MPKRWRKGLLLVGSGLLVLAILAAGTATWLHWQAQRNDPDRIFQEALQLSLSAKKLHAETVSATGRSQVDYDFSNSADPTISSDTTLQITGENFGVAGYGTSRDSFISYTKLPDFITPDLAATVGGSWVQLRQEGRLPTGVSSTLANLADPRYQAFGPLILGNYAPKTRQELINFMLANRIYAYNNTGVTKQTLGDSSVLVYTAKLNTNYLKIANQSAAANLKFQPEEIKAAIDALDQIKDKRLILYVTAADHRIKQLQFNGLDGRTKITYSQYDQAELPGEPQTKVVWKNFSPAYSQITAQITAYQAKNLTKAQH